MNISVFQISDFAKKLMWSVLVWFSGALRVQWYHFFQELACSTPCAFAPYFRNFYGEGVVKNKVFNFFHFVVSTMRLDERIPNLVSKFKLDDIWSLFGKKTVENWQNTRFRYFLIAFPSVDGWDEATNKCSQFHATYDLLSNAYCLKVTHPAWAKPSLVFRWEDAFSGFRDRRDFEIGIGIEIPPRSRDCNL